LTLVGSTRPFAQASGVTDRPAHGLATQASDWLRAACLAALATVALLGIARDGALAVGGDGRASHLTGGVAALAFALSAVRSAARWSPSRVALAAAVALALLVVPKLEGLLSGAVLAGGEGLLDPLTIAIAIVVVGAPAAALGAIAGPAALAPVDGAIAGSALGLAILDGPSVPLPASQALAIVAPFALVSWPRGPASPEADRSRRVAHGIESIGLFLLGAGIASGFVAARLELRSFVRGSTWDLAQLDGTMLAVLALGTLAVGRPLRSFGAGGIALAAAIAGGAWFFGQARVNDISLPAPFRQLLSSRQWGIVIDSAAYAPFLVVATFPLALAFAGGALGAAARARTLAAPLLGAGIVLLAAVPLAESRSVLLPDGITELDGFKALLWVALIATSAAGALLAVAPCVTPVRRTSDVALAMGGALACTGVAVFAVERLPPARQLPVSNFYVEIPTEKHSVHAARESVDGVALLVEEPTRREGKLLVRNTRVRVDRAGRTPQLDDRGGYELTVAMAASLHGAPRRVLLLGPALPRVLEILRSAGAEQIDSAPDPWIEGGPAAVFKIPPGFGEAAPDGLRVAAGRRGYDLVLRPPEPSDPSAIAFSMRPEHLRALEQAVAPGGLFAYFVDLATTPVDALDAMASGFVDGREAAAISFAADGIAAPSVGFLSRHGPPQGALAAEREREVVERAPSLPDRASLDGLTLWGGRSGAASAVGSWLPPVSTRRSFEQVWARPLRMSLDWVEVQRARKSEGARWAREALESGAASPSRKAAIELARAIEILDGAAWEASPLRPPVESLPAPQEALDAILAGQRAAPGHAALRAAYRQLERRLEAQRELARALAFAKADAELDPSDWAPCRDAAARSRELLDPEGALDWLDRAPPSATDAGDIAIAVERARTLIALQRGDEAIDALSAAYGRHSKAADVVIELGETCRKLGRLDDARRWAKLSRTLTPLPEAEMLEARVEAAIKERDQPATAPREGR